MTPGDRAVARARGYRLLGELLLHGPDRADRRALDALLVEPTDPEILATQFVTAFDLGVPPYASAFLELDGRAGGAVSGAAADAIRSDGFEPMTDAVAPCHIGVLLAHAGALCADGREHRAARFVSVHLLRWMPSFAVALESIAAPAWSGVVSMALQLCLSHAAMTPSLVDDAGPALDAPTSHPLDDPGSGLKDVAAWLAVPARCGIFVTDADGARIGGALDLPRGFGSRRLRLENLLRAAADYGAIEALCAALDDLFAERARRLLGLAGDTADGPAPSAGAPCRVPPALRPWIARIETTRSMLRTLADGASGVAATAG